MKKVAQGPYADLGSGLRAARGQKESMDFGDGGAKQIKMAAMRGSVGSVVQSRNQKRELRVYSSLQKGLPQKS